VFVGVCGANLLTITLASLAGTAGNNGDAAGNDSNTRAARENAAKAAEKRREAPRPNTSHSSQEPGLPRNDSWAWRRDNGEPTPTNSRTPRNPPTTNNRNYAQYETNASKVKKDYNPWNCTVCARANSSDTDACSVCFTKKGYKKKERAGRGSMPGGAQGKESASNYAAEARAAAGQGGENAARNRPSTTGSPLRTEKKKDATKDAAPAAEEPVEFEATARAERPWWEVEEEEKKKKLQASGQEDAPQASVPRGPSIRVSDKPNATPHRASTPMNAAQEVETDEEYEDEDTWEFTEDDAAEVDTTFESYDSGREVRQKSTTKKKTSNLNKTHPGPVDEAGGEGGGGETFLLNVTETKLHNVRREPFFSSPVIGHLLTDKPIESTADCGDWLRVRFHRPFEGEVEGEEKKDGGAVETYVAHERSEHVSHDERNLISLPPSSLAAHLLTLTFTGTGGACEGRTTRRFCSSSRTGTRSWTRSWAEGTAAWAARPRATGVTAAIARPARASTWRPSTGTS